MNSPQDTTRTTSASGTDSRPAQQGGDPSSAPGQQHQASQDAGSRGRQSGQPSDPDDAVPGRQYQGSGVMNKSGRFGSSQGPGDLDRPDRPGSNPGGTKP